MGATVDPAAATGLPRTQEISPGMLRARSENEDLPGRARSFQRQARVEAAAVPDSVCDGANASVRRRAWQFPIEGLHALYAAH
jgi:hypothetical protein